MHKKSSRILIVDDTMPNIQMLGTVLRQEDYQINIAQNGPQALRMAERVLPDLILLDIMMPEMDGFEVCMQLKENPVTQDIPVIFLTARVDTCDVVRGFAIGAADYVTKPVEASILLARVRTHLSLYHKTQELAAIAHRDGLTLIANRRCFNEFLERKWQQCLSSAHPLSLLLLDIDYFKLYNDTYGHLQGDEVLKRVAQVLQEVEQEYEAALAARFGGEEFSIVIANTNPEQAYQIAQALQEQIRHLQIPHRSSLIAAHLTLSIGVMTVVPNEQTNVEDFLEAADQQLYAAKDAGRDCIARNQ